MDLGTFVNWVTVGIWIVASFKGLAKLLKPSAKPNLIRSWIASPTLTGILIFIGLAMSSLQWYLHRDYSAPFNDTAKLETITDKIFANQTVEIDGKDFRDCHFLHASLLFHGKSHFALESNGLNDVNVSTDNPVVSYAWALAKGVGLAQGIPFIGPDGKPLPNIQQPRSHN